MISIIVPVYNVEPFIRDCLDSIRNQTFQDWECILINDGSTDGSGSACRQYCKRDPRFKYIHQRNAGVSAARNTGLDAAQGEFISFVDPDDCIMDNFYSTMLDTLQKHNADIVSCAALSISEGDNYMTWSKGLKKITALGIPFLLTQENVIEGRDAIVMAIVNEQIGTVCWDKLYKQDLWQMRVSRKISHLGKIRP
ncbi:MAG: glycosyltransferase [Lachnospiraceae bacterium]|nr:glycosyltransferase [Lachnospiraceae bacterium]